MGCYLCGRKLKKNKLCSQCNKDNTTCYYCPEKSITNDQMHTPKSCLCEFHNNDEDSYDIEYIDIKRELRYLKRMIFLEKKNR